MTIFQSRYLVRKTHMIELILYFAPSVLANIPKPTAQTKFTTKAINLTMLERTLPNSLVTSKITEFPTTNSLKKRELVETTATIAITTATTKEVKTTIIANTLETVVTVTAKVIITITETTIEVTIIITIEMIGIVIRVIINLSIKTGTMDTEVRNKVTFRQLGTVVVIDTTVEVTRDKDRIMATTTEMT